MKFFKNIFKDMKMVNRRNIKIATSFLAVILVSIMFYFNPEIAIKMYSEARYGSSVYYDDREFKLNDNFYILHKRDSSYAIKLYKSKRKAVALTKGCSERPIIGDCLNKLSENSLVLFQDEECLILEVEGADNSYIVAERDVGLFSFTSDSSKIPIEELQKYCEMIR